MLRYLTSFLFAIVVLGSTADAAFFSHEGRFVITGKSGPCTNYDPVGGRGAARIRYQIPSVVDNEPDNILVLFFGGGTSGYRLQNGYFSGTYKSVEHIAVSHFGWGSNEPTYLQVAKFNFEPSSANPSNAQFMDLIVNIYNFDFMPGCLVTAKITLQPMP